MDYIKVSIGSLTDLDNLHDLKEYIENTILDWKKIDIEFDEEDLEE
jgi:hypothetical protein